MAWRGRKARERRKESSNVKVVAWGEEDSEGDKRKKRRSKRMGEGGRGKGRQKERAAQQQ